MYLYKELSWKIIGCCLRVHNEYGNGHNERIYHKALEEEFQEQDLNYISKPRIAVYSNSKVWEENWPLSTGLSN